MENNAGQLEFYMRGKTKDGVAFSPKHIPINELSAYTKELQKLLIGSNRKQRADIPISIEEGSLRVIPFMAAALESILSDLIELSKSDI